MATSSLREVVKRTPVSRHGLGRLQAELRLAPVHVEVPVHLESEQVKRKYEVTH